MRQAREGLADKWVLAGPGAEHHLAGYAYRPVKAAFITMALQRLGRLRLARTAVQEGDQLKLGIG